MPSKRALIPVRPGGWTRTLSPDDPPTFVLSGTSPEDVVVVEGVWPAVRLSSQRGGADAGPTGTPWVDSNTWRVQLGRALHPGKAIWVAATPPKETRAPEGSVLAYADAAAAGGHWIVDVPDADAWKRVAQAARFFAAHDVWSAWEPEAVLGLISDFRGQNEFLSGEILNLALRQRQPVRVLPAGSVGPASLKGLRAVIYADAAPPEPGLRDVLSAFARSGGVVVTSAAWGAVKSVQENPRFAIAPLGKGKLAVAKEFDDPYLIASDAQVLMSHRYDPVRFWNAGSLGSYYVADPDGAAGVVHLVNYSHFRRGDPVTAWFARPWKSARWWRIDSREPEKLRVESVSGGVEIQLPPVGVYAALELS